MLEGGFDTRTIIRDFLKAKDELARVKVELESEKAWAKQEIRKLKDRLKESF